MPCFSGKNRQNDPKRTDRVVAFQRTGFICGITDGISNSSCTTGWQFIPSLFDKRIQ